LPDHHGASLQPPGADADEPKVTIPIDERRARRPRRPESGFSTALGLVSMAVSLLLVAVLLLFGLNGFSGGGAPASAGGGPAAGSSILSRSSAEAQIKLCAEGRDSNYGRPPTAAQQATCVRDLLGQVSTGPS
jgi:hypothetical protein